MLPEEAHILFVLGNNLLDTLSSTTVFTLLYGIFILLFAISTMTFLRRGLLTRQAWIMFAVTIVSFSIASINIVAQIMAFAIVIRLPLVDNIQNIRQGIQIANMRLFAPNMISLWGDTILPVLSDSVVIWRAWVLFSEQWWVMIAPLVLLLASFGTALAYNILSSSPTGINAAGGGGGINLIFQASIALSMATNAVTTSIIGYKLWTHRKFVVHDHTKQWSPVQRVLFLLIESGVIYCSLQLVYLILDRLPSTKVSFTVWHVFFAVYFGLSAMYPTIIVVLVNYQRSFVNYYDFGTTSGKDGHLHSIGSRPPTVGHLSFALPLTTVNRTSTGSFSTQSMYSTQTADDVNEEKGSPEKAGIRGNQIEDGFERHVLSAPF